MNDELKKRFKRELSQLIGKECWGIVTSAGSHISFDFGEKIPREKPLDNKYLSEDVRKFESEYSFLIFCVWRVDYEQSVAFGAWTENEIVEKDVKKFLGQRVIDIELSLPAYDLVITFSEGLKLKIFCDQTNEEDQNDNYDFFTPQIIFSVRHKSVLETEEYK